MNSQTNTVASETLSQELKAKIAKAAELKTVERALKAAQRLAEWETETRAINPNYVVGSVRKATSDDESLLGHTHGQVCEIRCLKCREIRVVNLQDAKQVVFCKSCKKTADRAKTKLAKITKRLGDKTSSDLDQEIANVKAQLEAMTGRAAFDKLA